MADFGHIAIVAAFVVACYAALVGPLSARLRAPELYASARHGLLAGDGALTLAGVRPPAPPAGALREPPQRLAGRRRVAHAGQLHAAGGVRPPRLLDPLRRRALE